MRWVVKGIVLLVAVLVVGSLVLSACSAPAPSKPLTIVSTAEPSIADPAKFQDPDRWVFMSVAEPLVDHVGSTADLKGLIAEKWEPVNELTWRVTLRKGVKFHDGSTMDAKAYKDVSDWLFRKDSIGAAGEMRAQLAETDGVKVVGEYQVEFTTKNPNPIFPAWLLRVPVPSAKQVRESPDSVATTLVGSGPYKIKEWRKGEYVLLEAFNDYWGPKPSVKEVKFLFRKEATVRAAMLKTGEADIALELTAETAVDAPKTESFQIPEVIHIRLNPSHPALQDVRVRQALIYALDRQAIVDNLYKGFGVVMGTVVNDFVLGANPDVKPLPFDQAKAKQLLQEAGYKGTSPLTLYIRPARAPRETELAEAMQRMWKEVGVDVKVQVMENTPWLDLMRLQTREPEKYKKGAIVADMMEWPTGAELFDSWQALDANFSGTGANSVLINEQADPELNKMIVDAGKISEPKARAEALKKVWAVVGPKAYSIPLVSVKKIHGMALSVEWKPRADGMVKAQEMAFKK